MSISKPIALFFINKLSYLDSALTVSAISKFVGAYATFAKEEKHSETTKDFFEIAEKAIRKVYATQGSDLTEFMIGMLRHNLPRETNRDILSHLLNGNHPNEALFELAAFAAEIENEELTDTIIDMIAKSGHQASPDALLSMREINESSEIQRKIFLALCSIGTDESQNLAVYLFYGVGDEDNEDLYKNVEKLSPCLVEANRAHIASHSLTTLFKGISDPAGELEVFLEHVHWEAFGAGSPESFDDAIKPAVMLREAFAKIYLPKSGLEKPSLVSIFDATMKAVRLQAEPNILHAQAFGYWRDF